MLHTFLILHDLPALETEHVTVAFLFRPVEVPQELIPIFSIFLDHFSDEYFSLMILEILSLCCIN